MSESEFEIPAYPLLESVGIYDPIAFVQRYMRTHPGSITTPAPQSTIPRCPVGKKAADIDARRLRQIDLDHAAAQLLAAKSLDLHAD